MRAPFSSPGADRRCHPDLCCVLHPWSSSVSRSRTTSLTASQLSTWNRGHCTLTPCHGTALTGSQPGNRPPPRRPGPVQKHLGRVKDHPRPIRQGSSEARQHLGVLCAVQAVEKLVTGHLGVL